MHNKSYSLTLHGIAIYGYKKSDAFRLNKIKMYLCKVETPGGLMSHDLRFLENSENIHFMDDYLASSTVKQYKSGQSVFPASFKGPEDIILDPNSITVVKIKEYHEVKFEVIDEVE